MLSLLLACAAGPATNDPGTLGKDTGSTDTSSTDDSGTDDSATTGELHGKPPAEAIPAPTFAATNRDGSARSKPDLTDGATVIWFYPAAGTYG
jgi:hypothetical protein